MCRITGDLTTNILSFLQSLLQTANVKAIKDVGFLRVKSECLIITLPVVHHICVKYIVVNLYFILLCYTVQTMKLNTNLVCVCVPYLSSNSVERAEALPGLDTFAVVEVGNSVVRTQTVYRSASPSWDKTFHL